MLCLVYCLFTPMSVHSFSCPSFPSKLTMVRSLIIMLCVLILLSMVLLFAYHGRILFLKMAKLKESYEPSMTASVVCLFRRACPLTFWVEALSTTTYLLNRRPCQATGHLTSFQILLGAPPRYDHLRVFGCLRFPNQSTTVPHKLSAHSAPCVFLCYPSDHRGYRCFDLSTRRVITSGHVTFNEHLLPFHDSSTSSHPPSQDTVPHPTTDVVVL